MAQSLSLWIVGTCCARESDAEFNNRCDKTHIPMLMKGGLILEVTRGNCLTRAIALLRSDEKHTSCFSSHRFAVAALLRIYCHSCFGAARCAERQKVT